MRLSVFREDFFCHRVQLVAVSFQAVFHHTCSAFRVNTTFQRGIGLQADNYFVFFVYITWSISIYALRIFCFSVVNTFLPFYLKHFSQFIPNLLRLIRGALQERIIPFIRFIIVLDKIPYINLSFPNFAFELRPVLVFKLHTYLCLLRF